MSGNERICKDLVEKCKLEAKQLAELTATRKNVHWTHPNFVSFCVSVENILSYGVKKKFQTSRSKFITPSGNILHEKGKTLPEAATIYDKYFSESSEGKKDYLFVRGISPAEKKVGWIRAALVEGKLHTIVQSIVAHPRQFYMKESVMCHPVYGEIFQYLIDGPCSIRYSRLKTSDLSLSSPSPAEIVKRHNQVLSSSTLHRSQLEDREFALDTEEAWDHVRSLYQSTASTCLFGKNSIEIQPAGFTKPLQGYLTLQHNGPPHSLMLKWIPNSLLQDSTSAHSILWKAIMSIDLVSQIAHIHCHRILGHSAQLILIGYDGIAHPPLIFPLVSSFFLFLECVENSLLPQGCLEPPLWYIKDMATKSNMAKDSSQGNDHVTKGEWFEGFEVWNQVFHVRYGPHPNRQVMTSVTESEGLNILASPPPVSRPFSLNPSGTIKSIDDASESGDSEFESEMMVTVEKPGCLARGDWEKFQSKVSRQLLARYFYSWLSHCRHMTKVRASIAHLVGSTSLTTDSHTHKYSILGRQEWEEFLKSAPSEREGKWAELVKAIYFRGIQDELRKEVWPHLLGIYQADSSQEEQEAILKQITEQYEQVLGAWQGVELTKKEIENEVEVVNGHRSGSVGDLISPSLSTISGSLPSSPDRSCTVTSDRSHCKSRDILCDLKSGEGNGDCTPVVEINGISYDSVSNCVERIDEELLDDAVISQGERKSSDKHYDNFSPYQSLDLSNDQSHDRSHDQSHDQTCNSELSSSGLLFPHDPEELVMSSLKLNSRDKVFVKELYTIDKDIPRCDRDYWYFESQANLTKVRNVVCSFVWTHLSEGYSQGMCDLLCPFLVILDSEPMAYACYLSLMKTAIKLFPPNTAMNTRLANVQALLQVMEADFYEYLSEKPMGDGLFYAYRWLLVTFKREFSYASVFRLWETIWAAKISKVSPNFEEFFALAIMKQFKSPIMDAHLDPSDILNLFTDLAEKKSIDVEATIKIAQETIQILHSDLTSRKDC